MDKVPVVAVLNTSPDTIELLSLCFEHHGLVVVSGFTFDIRDGHLDLERFLRQHRVDVVVYDIAPPYGRNWLLFQHLRETLLQEHPCVLTSTNVRILREIIGAEATVFEVLERPHSVEAILNAVRAALPHSPHRRPQA